MKKSIKMVLINSNMSRAEYSPLPIKPAEKGFTNYHEWSIERDRLYSTVGSSSKEYAKHMLVDPEEGHSSKPQIPLISGFSYNVEADDKFIPREITVSIEFDARQVK